MMKDGVDQPAARKRRSGGGAARRAVRQTRRYEVAKAIDRNVPTFDILSSEALEIIEANAETVLEEIGVIFADHPVALERWREAGADVVGDRVHLPKGLARQLASTAPSEFTQIARNPERNVPVGGKNLVFAPVYGPPFVRDLEGGRRYGTIGDFENFVRLAYLSPWLHHSGGTVCEPTDLPVETRHLDMLAAHMTLSDKPLMGSVTAPERAADSVAMAEILFGGLDGRTALTSLININSPLTFDATMVGALEEYARSNQASIVSPFIVGGAMSPVSVAGTLTQVLAEVLAGVAYAQLIRPGAPVIFGAFVTSTDMGSGAPTFGTPEASQITYGAGQLARRLGLPYRSGGSFTGAKRADAQSGYETANSLNAAVLAGVNFMLHSAGWLEGGLVAGFEKFLLDADQLGALHKFAAGISVDEEAQALDAIREVRGGPGANYFGAAHTYRHFESAFWRSEILDYRTFETWSEAGAPDIEMQAGDRVKSLLKSYESPALDPGIRDGLAEFMARRKEEIGS